MRSPNTYHLTKISEKVLTHGVNIASSLFSKKSIILQNSIFSIFGNYKACCAESTQATTAERSCKDKQAKCACCKLCYPISKLIILFN